jgi:hypothetical protein
VFSKVAAVVSAVGVVVVLVEKVTALLSLGVAWQLVLTLFLQR